MMCALIAENGWACLVSFVLGLVHCQPWPKILINVLLIGPGTVELCQVSRGRAPQILR